MLPTSNTVNVHWQTLYRTKAPTQLSWYQPHLTTSLRLLAMTGVGLEGQTIDVGGGASTFVDDCLERGFKDMTVLDLSSEALKVAKERLGKQAGNVTWIEGDVTQDTLPSSAYDVWHDRAVFHFLADPQARQRYVTAMHRAVKPGGHVIIAAFGPHGPPRCSGLDVVRYAPETLQAEFGQGMFLTDSLSEDHRTPFGTIQEFIYCHFRKMAGIPGKKG